MKLIAHGQTHKRTHTLDTLIVPFDKLRHVPNGQLTNAIVSVCATLSAGDLRARVAEQAFGKPFAKVTISKCGVYDDASAPPPVEEAVVVVEPQQVGRRRQRRHRLSRRGMRWILMGGRRRGRRQRGRQRWPRGGGRGGGGRSGGGRGGGGGGCGVCGGFILDGHVAS